MKCECAWVMIWRNGEGGKLGSGLGEFCVGVLLLERGRRGGARRTRNWLGKLFGKNGGLGGVGSRKWVVGVGSVRVWVHFGVPGPSASLRFGRDDRGWCCGEIVWQKRGCWVFRGEGAFGV